MQKYDLTILTKTDLIGEVKDKFLSRLEQTVKALEGKVIKTNDMGKKQLAYMINKLSEANFTEIMLEVPGNAVVQLNKKLTVDRDVIRHLLVRVEK